ncbi:MAG: ABC transporter ATP-binding protein/permease, partial [Ignavibacteria bacterium]|nr:ABC transporter ATP-binding protein/permease [Ignavibacteria bacterium]
AYLHENLGNTKQENGIMKIYLRLVGYIYKNKKYIFTSFVLSVLLSFFNALSIYLTIPLLKTLFAGEQSLNPVTDTTQSFGIYNQFRAFLEENLFSHGKYEALVTICILIFLSYLLKNISGFFQSLSIQRVEKSVLTDLRFELYRKINQFSVRYFTSEKTGNLISRMTNDLNAIQSGISAAFSNLIKEPLTIGIFLFLALSISYEMTLISLVIFPVTVIFIAKIGSSLRRRSQRLLNKLSEILTTVNETIYGAKIIRAFGSEEYLNKKFRKQNDEAFRLGMKAAVAFEMSSPITEIVSVIAGIIIIWYGGKQILINNALNPEEFLGFLFIVFQLMVPLKNLSVVNNRIQESSASGKRIFEVLDYEVEIKEKPDALEISNFNDSIELKNVSFYYNENAEILRNINLSIKKSEIVAIVGPSGSGKSTLADLIMRFYDVTAGGITIDGTDIRDLKINNMRHLMSLVPQETILFNDTIRNNILFGMEDVSDEQIFEAARNANAYDFIKETENGLDTIVGERGLKLSGGQKQRIAIARALLRNPQILILDEATSSLDTESEKIVQDAIDNLMKNRTSIVIAHRLSTIINADKIVVLNGKTIMQTGTHEELLKQKDGLYRKLYEIQI